MRRGLIWRDLSKFDLPASELAPLFQDLGNQNLRKFKIRIPHYGIRYHLRPTDHEPGSLEVSFSVTEKSDRIYVRMQSWIHFGRKTIQGVVQASAEYDDPRLNAYMQDFVYHYYNIILQSDDRLMELQPINLPKKLTNYIPGLEYWPTAEIAYRVEGDPERPFSVRTLDGVRSKPTILDI